MNIYRIGPPPKWWEPKLAPWLVRITAGYRRKVMQRRHRVAQVQVHGADNLQQPLADGCGVMITPNHSSHADPHALYDAADQIGTPLYVMATWHVFQAQHRLGRWLLQKHGCFSVDRDAADLRAFKEAVRLLREEHNPLVIFPEGEIYHCNDRLTPFLEGPATMALTAARRAERRVVIVPCAMKYEYLDDPMDCLLDVMTRLELRVLWRPRPDKPIVERIYDLAEALISLKEIEYLGHANRGELTDRVNHLACAILQIHEQTRGIDPQQKSIPERVKEIRRRAIKDLADEKTLDDEALRIVYRQLDDAFLVGQMFSYPGNYLAESPSIERLAETIDKLEEDVLQLPTATIKGTRKVDIYFDEPISISSDKASQPSPAELTRTIEQHVQNQLDQHFKSSSGESASIGEPVNTNEQEGPAPSDPMLNE